MEEKITENKNRIEWIDIAKGISIILVVYGHCGLSSFPNIADWFGGFRMPFFFFISGILFNPYKYNSISDLIKKKQKGLIRPFFIFSIIIFIGYFFLDRDNFISKVKMFPSLGWGGYALWFIPVLLGTEMLYYFICSRIYKKNYIFIALLTCALFGYMLDKMNVPNYWNLNFIFTSVLFFGLGNILHSPLVKFFQKNSLSLIWIALISGLLVSLLFFLNKPKPEFFINTLGIGGLTHIVALGGALMLCCTAAIISRYSHALMRPLKYSFKYFGKNSYVVLAFHQLSINMIMALSFITSGTIGRILMWISLVLIIEFLTRYMPFVLGRKKKNKG